MSINTSNMSKIYYFKQVTVNNFTTNLFLNMISKLDLIKFFALILLLTAVLFVFVKFIKSPERLSHKILNKVDNRPEFNSTVELLEFLKSNPNFIEEFSFVQQTIKFDENEKPNDTAIWYEAIKYPDKFRIDFGQKEDRNSNINRNDSIYVFRNNKLVHSGPEIQEFLILEGGVHYYSIPETIEKLEKLGINTSIFNQSMYKGHEIYIIGAVDGDLAVPQIWLDKNELYCVRRFSIGSRSGNLYDVRYGDFKDFNGFKIETWIEFYRNNKLVQTEAYTNVNIEPAFDDAIFDPKKFGKHYWY